MTTPLPHSDAPPDLGVITHVALLVTDPESAAAWYERVLGLKIVVRAPDACFLSFGPRHHEVALIRASAPRSQGSVGLHHFAMTIRGGPAELRRQHARFVSLGVSIDRISDHAVGWGLYFFDPDGNRLELFCDRDMPADQAQSAFSDAGAPSKPISIDEVGAKP